MATYEDVIPDVIVFLRETLSSETLSPNANRQRLALLLKLSSKIPADGCSPMSYVDMNSTVAPRKLNGNCVDVSNMECYEEVESNSEWSGCSSSNMSKQYNNVSLYYDRQSNRLSSSSRSNDSRKREDPYYENTYVGIDSSSSDSSPRNSSSSSTSSDHSTSPTWSRSEIGSMTPASVKCSAVKCGQLSRKERILFVEHSKRYWAALVGAVMFLYGSEKESKPPSSVIHVEEYKARPIISSPTSSTKKEFGFEIICPGKKTYQFYANLKDDMESWISLINECTPSAVSSSNQNERVCCEIGKMISPCVPVCHNSNTCSNYQNATISKQVGKPQEVGTNMAVDRELPSLPPLDPTIMYQHYDRPNPIVRPVLHPVQIGGAESRMQETLYHCIDEPDGDQLPKYDYPIKKELCPKKHGAVETEDALYYNTMLLAGASKIDDTNKNADSVQNGTRSNDTDEEKENRASVGTGRIQQLIQQMEEISQKNCGAQKKISSSSSSRNSKAAFNATNLTLPSDEIYELVSTPTLIIDSKA